MCLFQHVGKQDRTHARTNMVKIALRKLFAGILCGCVVLLVGCEVSDGKKPSKPIHIITAIFTTRVHKENKQVLPYQPTLLKTLTNIIYCMCLFQHVGKQDRTHARTHMVKIALRKLVAGILCGCVVLLVLVAKWVMEKNIQTYPYSNCTFHHQSSQRKQTSFTVPTNLGKTLASIICCMCIFQHVGKQDRTHARTNMVKIALRKLVAGILCGCVVLLVCCEVSDGKNNPNTSIFELHFPPPEFTKKTNKF